MAKDRESNLEIENKDIEILDIPKPEETNGDIIPEETKKKPAKKKKKKPAIKPSSPSIGQNDISALIQATFALVALKGGSHWNITQEESDSVAKPLSNILQKMDLLEKVSNVSDGLALTIAVAGITIPRIIVTKQLIDAKKGSKFDGIREEKQANESSSSPENRLEDYGGVHESPTSDGEFIQELSTSTLEQPI